MQKNYHLSLVLMMRKYLLPLNLRLVIASSFSRYIFFLALSFISFLLYSFSNIYARTETYQPNLTSKSIDTLKPVKNLYLRNLTGFSATQSSTAYGAGADLAIDGNTYSDFMGNDLFNSVSCTTRREHNPWWLLDLQEKTPIDQIIVWNRTDDNVGHRLNNYILEILDDSKEVVFRYDHKHNFTGTNSFVTDTIFDINRKGRFIRIRLDTEPGNKRHLTLAEVQVFSLNPEFRTPLRRTENDFNQESKNFSKSSQRDLNFEEDSIILNTNGNKVIGDEITNAKTTFCKLRALDKSNFSATQSSINLGAGADLAIDGNFNSDFVENDLFNSVTCTLQENDPWWEVNLKEPTKIDQIVVWNRTDDNVEFRLNNYILEILDESRSIVYSYAHKHNYKGSNSFIVDTISNIQTTGHYIRIRLETRQKKTMVEYNRS